MQLGANVVGYLASVAVRSLVLAGAATLALVLLRVKSAAGRHAVWTTVMLGMLLLAVAEPLLPPLPLHVLKAVQTAPLQLPEVPLVTTGARAVSQPVSGPNDLPCLSWQDAAAALWALGALILLARLAISYLFTRRLLRAARPIGRPWAAGIYESAWISVPMTVGARILLPAAWDEWDPSKLAAVLAHERTHLRRRDWAIAVTAVVSRAVFWFHPLAWWLDRQLASLAEQACDDAALLEVPGAPYAQALLDLAAAVETAEGRLIWEGVAMAKTADVSMRIERALDETRAIPRPWTRRRWLALAACGLPLVWLTAVTQLAPAIAQEQRPPDPQFEVASIKLNTTGARAVSIGASSPRSFKAENVWLRFLIEMAWNVKDYQLSGGPDWATSNRYDIDARTETNASFEQMRPMLQALLKDRFQLALHHESKDLPVYSLVAAKGGVKLKVSAKENCTTRDPSAPPSAPTPGQTHLSFCGALATSPRSLNGTAISMEQLTAALSNTMQRTVIDQTGFTGPFDVHLEWTEDQSTPGLYAPGLAPPPSALPANGSGPTVFTVLQEQLGLKLESTKGPVTILVIDRAVRPSPN